MWGGSECRSTKASTGRAWPWWAASTPAISSSVLRCHLIFSTSPSRPALADQLGATVFGRLARERAEIERRLGAAKRLLADLTAAERARRRCAKWRPSDSHEKQIANLMDKHRLAPGTRVCLIPALKSQATLPRSSKKCVSRFLFNEQNAGIFGTPARAA
jgi:hypothetical protein